MKKFLKGWFPWSFLVLPGPSWSSLVLFLSILLYKSHFIFFKTFYSLSKIFLLFFFVKKSAQSDAYFFFYEFFKIYHNGSFFFFQNFFWRELKYITNSKRWFLFVFFKKIFFLNFFFRQLHHKGS